MRRQLSHPIAFWVVAITNITFLLSSAAPSPLYPVYQQAFGFSAFMLTVIFAVYVVALVATLLTVGSISDHIGRRPVLALSLAMLAIAMVMFATANGVGMLLGARILQGLATGAMVGTASAALVDLAPSPRLGSMLSTISPAIGLSLGSLLAGVLVEYAPLPRQLVFIVLLVSVVILLATMAALPETSALRGFTSRRHAATVVAPRIAVSSAMRGLFVSMVPAMFATWSLGGLYLSLGSSIAAQIFAVHNHALVGVILAAFFVSAAFSGAVGSKIQIGRALALGYSGLIVGVALTVVAIAAENVAVYLIGSIIAGLGFGITLLAIISSLASAIAANERATLFASVFAISYTAFSVPAVIAGLLTTHIGLRPTAVGYAVFVIILGLIASTAAVVIRRRENAQIAAILSDDADDILTPAR